MERLRRSGRRGVGALLGVALILSAAPAAGGTASNPCDANVPLPDPNCMLDGVGLGTWVRFGDATSSIFSEGGLRRSIVEGLEEIDESSPGMQGQDVVAQRRAFASALPGDFSVGARVVDLDPVHDSFDNRATADAFAASELIFVNFGPADDVDVTIRLTGDFSGSTSQGQLIADLDIFDYDARNIGGIRLVRTLASGLQAVTVECPTPRLEGTCNVDTSAPVSPSVEIRTRLPAIDRNGTLQNGIFLHLFVVARLDADASPGATVTADFLSGVSVEFQPPPGAGVILGTGEVVGRGPQGPRLLISVPSPRGDQSGNATRLWEIYTLPYIESFVGSLDVKGISGLDRQPETEVLFGSSGRGDGGRLFTIDPVTPGVTLVGDTDFPFVPGLAFDAGGTLYGSASTVADCADSLVTIDPQTAAATAVGRFHPQSLVFIDGLAVHPATDVLYGAGSVCDVACTCAQHTLELYTIDKSTGVATSLGAPLGSATGTPLPPNPITDTFFGGLGFSPDGELVATMGSRDGRILSIDVSSSPPRFTVLGDFADTSVSDVFVLEAPEPGAGPLALAALSALTALTRLRAPRKRSG